MGDPGDKAEALIKDMISVWMQDPKFEPIVLALREKREYMVREVAGVFSRKRGKPSTKYRMARSLLIRSVLQSLDLGFRMEHFIFLKKRDIVQDILGSFFPREKEFQAYKTFNIYQEEASAIITRCLFPNVKKIIDTKHILSFVLFFFGIREEEEQKEEGQIRRSAGTGGMIDENHSDFHSTLSLESGIPGCCTEPEQALNKGKNKSRSGFSSYQDISMRYRSMVWFTYLSIFLVDTDTENCCSRDYLFLGPRMRSLLEKIKAGGISEQEKAPSGKPEDNKGRDTPGDEEVKVIVEKLWYHFNFDAKKNHVNRKLLPEHRNCILKRTWVFFCGGNQGREVRANGR